MADHSRPRLHAIDGERRARERWRASGIPASLSTDDLEIECEVEVENVSRGGLFVRSDFLEPTGTRVRLQVETPLRELEVIGRVAWVREHGVPGMGIEIDDASRANWIAHLRRIA